MKKALSNLLAICLACVLSGAQEKMNPEIVEMLKADLTLAGGNTNGYTFYEIEDTPAPKGYKPVYVSHYGRHGSRSNWAGSRYQQVIDVLQKAKEEGILTECGDSLLREVSEIENLYGRMNGRLTPKGVREHARLADRMFKRFNPVFKGGKKVRAVASTSPRCIVSMCGFTNQLARLNPKLTILPDTGEKYMEYINYPATNNKNPEELEQRLRDRRNSFDEDTCYTFKILFSDQQKAHAIAGGAHKFYDNIFEAGIISDDFEVTPCPLRYLPMETIYKWWSYYNGHLYYHNGNSVEYGRTVASYGQTLVEDIVNKADEALHSRNDIAADLRFGHDYNVYVLAAYLGLEGVGDRLSFDEVDYHWFAFRDLCMASNFQAIFYRNAKGHILVKFLYQEKERLLRGLDPVEGPYYDWNTVKANTKGYLR